MTISLSNLINEARAAAIPGPVWITDGGRACPLGWCDCSQPVFLDQATGAHDYGDPGGPGAHWCATECPHGGQVPGPDDESLDEVV